MTDRPKIMFVDDEQRVLDGLSGSLWRCRRIWDMKFVCGGAAAVETFRTQRFDAIVTDMRMPDVDGEAVLLAASAYHPGTLRVILSGQTDREVLARTTSVAHQFLSKPCAPDELRECLERMLVIARPMPDPMRDLVCSVGRLPVSQRSLARLDELFRDSDVDPAEVARCVEADIGLTAKLLHVAGAGFFAHRRPVTSVAAAIDILGLDVVRTFVQSVEVEELSEDTESLFCDQVLLHGLGQLAMLQRFGAAYGEMMRSSELHALELARFGVTHDQVGVNLVELWGISPAMEGARLKGGVDRSICPT
jgi:CheY-like chemotaxis protein